MASIPSSPSLRETANPVYVLKWVTDPHLPDINIIHRELVMALQGDRFEVLSSYSIGIDRGLVETSYAVRTRPGPAQVYGQTSVGEIDPIQDLLERIGQINYLPVTMTMKVDLDYISPEELDGARTIVKALVELDVGTTVEVVVPTDFSSETDRFISFTPYTNQRPIYQHSDYLKDLIGVDLDNLRGYQAISTDPLTFYAVDRYQASFQDLSPSDIKVVKGLLLLKISDRSIIVRQLIEDTLAKLRQEGYFTLPPDSRIAIDSDPVARAVYPEIATMWQGHLIHSGNGCFPMVFRSSIGFDMVTAVWYQRAAELIVRGQLPRYKIQGSWQQLIRPIPRTTVLDVKIRLTYVAWRAYARLIQKYLVLAPFAYAVVVLDDLSIEASFASYAQVEDFRSSIQAEIYEGHNMILQYRVLPVAQISDGIALRRYVQRNRPHLSSLVVTVYHDNRSKFYVVVNTRAQEDLPFISTELPTIIQEARAELTDILQSTYASRCQLPSNIDLEQLLSIVPVYDSRGAVDGCLPGSIEVSSSARLLADQLEWGWRGLFSMGQPTSLEGLLTKPVDYHRITVDKGTPIVDRVNYPETTPSSPRLTSFPAEEELGQLLSVGIAFYQDDFIPVLNQPLFFEQVTKVLPSAESRPDPGVITPLFDLSVPASLSGIKEELEELTETSWRQGLYKSPWGTSVLIATDKISRSPYLLHNNIHLGADSPADGLRALTTLRSMVSQVKKIPSK